MALGRHVLGQMRKGKKLKKKKKMNINYKLYK